MELAPLVRRVLGPDAALKLRPLNRLRWIAKAREARAYAPRHRNRRPLAVARFVLWDPQVGDYSYDILNRDEFAAATAAALDVPTEKVLGWFDEAEHAPALDGELRRLLRTRADLHDEPGLGLRLAWYAMVRATRPELVVETGIKHGFGSLTLLAALERNAQDGHLGRLVSIDSDPDAGSLVPSGRYPEWERIVGMTPDDLRGPLAGRTVDLFIHDTPPWEDLQRAEFALAREVVRPGGRLVSGGNGDYFGVLAEVARSMGADCFVAEDQADHPIYPGGCVVVIQVPDAAAPAS